jgi:hypothetical protein
MFELCCIILFMSCNQSKNDNKSVITATNSAVENRNALLLNNFDKWLSNKTLVKPQKLFLEILKRAQDSAIGNACDKAFYDSMQDESKFMEIINGFKIIPLKDKYLFIRGLNTWISTDVGTIISLIDDRDSILSFRYECCSYVGSPDSRIDSIYLNDWQKNGNPDLMMKAFSRFSNNSDFQIAVYDFTSKGNQIIKSFDYNFFHEFRDQYWIYRKKDLITFERPDLIKVVSKNFDVPRKIRKEDYDETAYYKFKLKKQEEAKDTTHEPPRYFQLDSVSKIFIAIEQ